ncbi:MAG: hypothetical protein D6790_00860 [Caldilineae bacterium]|nr:MAG: hypothetical protein D6790_00860 [Caldilineae bacterium]
MLIVEQAALESRHPVVDVLLLVEVDAYPVAIPLQQGLRVAFEDDRRVFGYLVDDHEGLAVHHGRGLLLGQDAADPIGLVRQPLCRVALVMRGASPRVEDDRHVGQLERRGLLGRSGGW